LRNFFSRYAGPHGNRLFPCLIGNSGGNVDAYGHFQVCLQLKHPGLSYDLRKGSLGDALNALFPRIEKMEAKNEDYLRRCARCFLKGFCEQCPAKSWMEHGSLDTPVDYLCRIAHLQAEGLGLIKKGELAWEVNNWKERIASVLSKR
jgi:radical SAM protein with 4Fe4S-binding SPASM domain